MAKTEEKKIDQRTASYGARSRGQTACYMPGESVPIPGVGIRCGDVVIVTDPSSPFYDERAMEPISSEMVDDVYELGIHTPPTVCQRPGPGGVKMVFVVLGRQRFFTAHLANVRRVAAGEPARVVSCLLRNDLDDMEIRKLIVSENEQRKADSLKNKVAKATRLFQAERERCEADGERFVEADAVKRLAMPFGVAVSVYRRWLAVPKLSDVARGAIYHGKVPLAQVDELVRMTSADQAKAVQASTAAGATTPREAKRATAALPRVEDPPTQKRRPRAAIEAKIAELEAEPAKQLSISKEADVADVARKCRIAALRYALGEDTL